MGEFALPFSFELAKRLRKAPRKIAEEIVAELPLPEGFEKFEVAGAGYINARLKRDVAAKALAADRTVAAATATQAKARPTSAAKFWSSTPCINPNKAAHIGHLRNAILGDTFVRLLRAAGHAVDVQNYIDNTGVQVADVVVGLRQLEKKSKAEIADLIALDAALRLLLLGSLRARLAMVRAGQGTPEGARCMRCMPLSRAATSLAEIAELISVAVLRRHLETMDRLDIEYDFLPRESEILHLHFWDAAFELLKEKGVLYFETEGKNKGCWVMTRPCRQKWHRGNRRRPQLDTYVDGITPLQRQNEASLEIEARSELAARPWRRIYAKRSRLVKLKSRPRRGCEGHRALQWHGRLCRQGHRLSPLEVRPAGPRLRLSALLPVSQPA